MRLKRVQERSCMLEARSRGVNNWEQRRSDYRQRYGEDCAAWDSGLRFSFGKGVIGKKRKMETEK